MGLPGTGILDDHKPWGYDYRSIKVIGTMKDLKPILDMNRLDEIAITLSLKELWRSGADRSGL